MHCTPPNGNLFITPSNTPNYFPLSTINADFSHLLWFCLPHVWSFLGSSPPRITLIFLFGVKGDPSAFPSLAIVLRVQSKSARHPVVHAVVDKGRSPRFINAKINDLFLDHGASPVTDLNAFYLYGYANQGGICLPSHVLLSALLD